MSSVEARLKEREQARRAAADRRRAERESDRRPEEAAGYFSQQFAAKKAAIEELLSAAEDVPQEQLPAHFDSLSTQCHALQKFFSDSTIFLTSYELRTSQQQISQLVQEVSAREQKLLPKKKFAFKSRKKGTQSQTTAAKFDEGGGGEGEGRGGGGGEQKGEGARSNIQLKNLVGFKDRKDEKLLMSADEVKGHDVDLVGLVSCEVRLCGAPSTLHINKMEGCTVLCGPVSSSIFVEDCKNCTFVAACQQLRVHVTVDSVFYLHVTSRAVIEDCSRVKFAPYTWTYPGIHDHFKEAGIDQDRNNWDKVDDFNWLASTDPSPNWSVLPEHERTEWS